MSTDASVEQAIDYVIKHNTGIIEGLVAAIMISALYLSYRSLTAKPEAAAGLSGNLGDLEETLKKLLEKASLVAPAGGASVTGSSPNPELLAQIDQLKKTLEERQGEMESLKAQAANAGTSVNLSNEEKAKLEAQIKELSSKLAEYEIISEDIADLSFYKEENAKLQKQLDAAKASGAVAPPPPPAAAPPAPAAAPAAAPPPPAPAAPIVEPEIVGKTRSTPQVEVSEEALASSPPPPPIEAAVTNSVIDDDLMAEFAKAVEEQKSSEAPVVPGAEAPLGSGVDMDKMMAEANVIGEAPAGEDGHTNALESTLDENKLMQEASELHDIKPEDKTLMNEFENFVKKGN
jgi:hypothetical protein